MNKLNLIFTILTIFGIAIGANGQTRKIVVIDEGKRPVTNLSVFISENFDHIKIDDRGILLLDSLKYNANDTIWIKTSFYRDTLFSLGEINDTITLISAQ